MRGDGTVIAGKARGGRTVYGGAVGVLMLETRFPRIPGDMGNALTWPFPMHFKVVRGASPDRVVRQQADGLLDAFKEAANELVEAGADGLTTTCGFLSLMQGELAEHVRVPVATSSLQQVSMVNATLPPRQRCGVVTVSAPDLTPAHLAAAGAPPDTPVVGTENGRELSRVMVGDEPELDVLAAEADVVEASLALLGADATVGALVLECTNMPPYAAAVQRATGVPVYDIVSFICWFQSGLRPRGFA
ncbi:MAG: aspartate/glutamate racemase family protein [Pseudomonadota bacterium]